MKLNFFIGYDSKEDIAYRVCKYSLLKRTNADVSVISLKIDELIAKNLYTRNIDPLASTQFTYSRFLNKLDTSPKKIKSQSQKTAQP